MIDSAKIRNDFPQLHRVINGKPIIYLDSTATSLKPRVVIDKEREYYEKYTANVFRGIYKTSEEATQAFEDARGKVANFIHAKPEEIVFTKNTSESLNLVAYSLLVDQVKAGDRIVTTIMEHHSNFVPWQQLSKHRGITLDIWETDTSGQLNERDLQQLITKHTKILALTAVSNVLGTINPIQSIIKKVKEINPNCMIVVDAAQAVPHMPVDVVEWGADFVAFSSHKMCGPTGIGVLWGKLERLLELKPFLFGGEMIESVTRETTTFNAPPHKFEAGTPHIAGVIGLGAAVDYLSALGMANVRQHEKELVEYAAEVFKRNSKYDYVGPKNSQIHGGVFAFTVKGIHPHDVAQILDEENVYVRAGNHCAMPLHLHLGIHATARASFYIYTTKSDIDALFTGLERVDSLLGK